MADDVRAYANSVLMQIGQATLTDTEAELLPKEYGESLILSAVAKVINKRGATGNAFKKLKAYATLHGVEIGESQKKKSDILIGMVLE